MGKIYLPSDELVPSDELAKKLSKEKNSSEAK